MATTTPNKIDDKIYELCKEISSSEPQYVICKPRNWCIQNECYSNVDRMISLKGGKRVLGWTIWEWEGVLVEAEAHAVWEREDGKLIDVSPHDGEGQILFLRDDKIVYNGRRIKSKRKALIKSHKIEELIELMSLTDEEGILSAPMMIQQRLAELNYDIQNKNYT